MAHLAIPHIEGDVNINGLMLPNDVMDDVVRLAKQNGMLGGNSNLADLVVSCITEDIKSKAAALNHSLGVLSTRRVLTDKEFRKLLRAGKGR